MPKRRANGEGNIRKRKDGRWEGRYTVGHDPETGKAIIKNVLGKTQAEVKEKLKKAIEENVGIDYGRAKTYTVGTWLEVWMENYAKVKLRPSTFKTSQGFLKNHIKPQIGGIPLADLTSLDLQRFYKHLLDGGRVDRIEAKKKPKGLAPKTVRNIHQMIGSAYNLAIEQKLVTRNPTQGCALPKVEHKEMKTLTADQLSAFFQEARDSGVYELYYLDLATGLRNHGAPDRRGHQDRQQYAGPLLGGLYAGHLRPRDHGRPDESRPDDGEHPLLCCLTVSATRSRWGQRLGQKKAAH